MSLITARQNIGKNRTVQRARKIKSVQREKGVAVETMGKLFSLNVYVLLRGVCCAVLKFHCSSWEEK
jgi:hypothetical protein